MHETTTYLAFALYLHSIYAVLGIISGLELIWEDVSRLYENATPFHTRDLSTEESGIPVWRWDALKPIPCGFGGTTL